MKRRRHTPEQIIRKLREADRLLAEGHEVPEVAKQLEISEATYHRWRAQYGEQALSFACRSAAVRPVPASNAAAQRLGRQSTPHPIGWQAPRLDASGT